jgi:hypothetical protein
MDADSGDAETPLRKEKSSSIMAIKAVGKSPVAAPMVRFLVDDPARPQPSGTRNDSNRHPP